MNIMITKNLPAAMGAHASRQIPMDPVFASKQACKNPMAVLEESGRDHGNAKKTTFFLASLAGFAGFALANGKGESV